MFSGLRHYIHHVALFMPIYFLERFYFIFHQTSTALDSFPVLAI